VKIRIITISVVYGAIVNLKSSTVLKRISI